MKNFPPKQIQSGLKCKSQNKSPPKAKILLLHSPQESVWLSSAIEKTIWLIQSHLRIFRLGKHNNICVNFIFKSYFFITFSPTSVLMNVCLPNKLKFCQHHKMKVTLQRNRHHASLKRRYYDPGVNYLCWWWCLWRLVEKKFLNFRLWNRWKSLH